MRRASKINPFQELRVEVPLHDEITVGEMETAMIAAKNPKDSRLYHYLVNGGVIYPNIHVPTNMNGEDQMDEDQNQPTAHFQTKDNILLSKKSDDKTIVQQLYESYVPETIRQYVNVINTTTQYALETTEKCAFYCPPLQTFFSARVPDSVKQNYGIVEDLIDKIPARTFDWHFTLFRFAVTLQDQSIYFYDLLREGMLLEIKTYFFFRMECTSLTS
jgi:hypothetical protein